MGDPKKPEQRNVTPAEAAAKLESCGAKPTDASSSRIRSQLASDAINEGRTGAEIASAARVPTNVGQCVADAYDGKKSGIAESARSAVNSLTEIFQSARTGLANAVSDAAIKPGQGPTTVNIHNNTTGRTNPEARL